MMDFLLKTMVGLLRRRMGFPRRESKTRAGSFPQGESKTRAENLPQTGSKTRAESCLPAKILVQNGEIQLVLIQDMKVSSGGRACAARLCLPCTSRGHGACGGWSDDRWRYGRKKHGAANARRHGQARSLQKPRVDRRRRRAKKQNGGDGTALGIALGISFQVRHRPIILR